MPNQINSRISSVGFLKDELADAASNHIKTTPISGEEYRAAVLELLGSRLTRQQYDYYIRALRCSRAGKTDINAKLESQYTGDIGLFYVTRHHITSALDMIMASSKGEMRANAGRLKSVLGL